MSVTAANGNEDNSIPLDIHPVLADMDGSESITAITINGIPANASLSNTAGDTLTINNGSITLTPGQLDGLAITPPPNSDANFDLSVTTTSTETSNGDTAASASVTLPVTVNAVADMPTLNVGILDGVEDQPIVLPLTVTLQDMDGSESISVTITDIPQDATLSAGTVNPDGSVTLTESELIGLTMTPPPNFHGVINLFATATSTEASNGDTATTPPMAINIPVTPVDEVPIANPDEFSGGIDEVITGSVGGNDDVQRWFSNK